MSKSINNLDVDKSDFLLKNWNIYHLHLEKAERGKKFTNDKLLFFYAKNNVVYFLDILKHPKGHEWFVKSVISIMYSNWRELFPNLSLQPVLADGTPVEDIPDEHMHELLKQVGTVVKINNEYVFPFNLGVTGAGYSVMAKLKANSLYNSLKSLEEDLRLKELEIKRNIFEQHNIKIEEPLEYELCFQNGKYKIMIKNYNIRLISDQEVIK